MDYYCLRTKIVRLLKSLFNIANFTVYTRRRKQDIQKLFYRKKYTADDIIEVIRQSGVNPGRPILVHSAMGNFYNYQGTAEELIDKLLEFVGPEGTVCMPAYPKDKFNDQQVFDVRNTKSAAGYLTEVFRNKPGVNRSLNQLHSVCALGKDAEYITKDHHKSDTSFDALSPFYRIAELEGYSISLGMPKWYVGTGEHICESELCGQIPFFMEKFKIEKEYTYIDWHSNVVKHRMKALSEKQYTRTRSTKLFDKYFDSSRYKRTQLSNIWIVVFEMKYLKDRLTELGKQGITIYSSPKFN